MSRSIEQLVDQQIMRWMAERQIADRHSSQPPSSEAGGERQRPVICISRECGARGAEVGRIAAQELGFGFYSQELVDEIAKQAHVRRKVVESLDERRRKGVSRWIDELVHLGRFTPSDYMRNLSAVVLTLGRHGESVLVGRGAFLILDPRSTLRVRCRAPLERRIAHFVQNRHLGEAEARATVVRIDAERVDFYRDNFDVDVRDPRHFDLMLDTGALGTRDCAAAVVDTFRARFGRESKSSARLGEAPGEGSTPPQSVASGA